MQAARLDAYDEQMHVALSGEQVDASKITAPDDVMVPSGAAQVSKHRTKVAFARCGSRGYWHQRSTRNHLEDP